MFFFFQQADNQNTDTPKEIDFNPGLLFERIDAWLDGFIRLLPNLVVAILAAVFFFFIARFVGRLIKKSAKSRDRENLGTVLGGFVKWIILILGFLIAATVVVPTLKPGDLIAGLGVGSVAIGFAFQDILQNWLAGLLILLRQPFEVGDQIVINGYEGTVERIETRATIIRQYNNERVVIPNNDIYTNAVKVKTANKIIRSQYDIGIGYGDNIPEAVEAIQEAVKSVEGVDLEKGVEALPWDLAASWVTIRARWWTNSERASVVRVYAKVIKQVKEALDEMKIDMPYETQVLLFHDQSEATDGDRSAQREGWPEVTKGENPNPRWKEQEKQRKENTKSNGEKG